MKVQPSLYTSQPVAESPAGVHSPSSTATLPTTLRAFTIFCSLSPPHPLLYLNDNSLPFNLFRILSSQTRTQRHANRWCAEDQEASPDTAGSCCSPYILTASSANIERTICVAVYMIKRMCQGIQYYIPVLLTAAYSNYLSIIKDIWCSSIQFLAHKKLCLSLGSIGLKIYCSPPQHQLDHLQLEPIIPCRL